jgi:DNA-binding transcriptional MerR regulator
MSKPLTIGDVSRRTGLPAKTIRFYEDEALVPRPRRSENGYRIYSERDIGRLAFIRRARLLGIELPVIRSLLDKASSQTCAEFGDELTSVLAEQRQEVERRLTELTLLRDDLDALAAHVSHCCEGCDPGEMVSECSYCCVISEQAKGGD